MFKQLLQKFNIWKYRFKKPPFFHRREIIALVTTILIFLVILSLPCAIIDFWGDFSFKKDEARIEVATQKELDDISKQREEIIKSEVFNAPLKRDDLLDILTISQFESKKRNIDIIVTDKDGFVFNRSHMLGQRGDNIFQTTLQGIDVAKGEIVTSVVKGSRSPLELISSSLILEKGKPIGSIFVGHVFNDNYAASIQDTYLKKGEQVVFDTLQDGIIGDSLKDKNKTDLLNAYFSLGSDIVSSNFSGVKNEIKIGNDYYIIHHLQFDGLGGSPGGAFILFPINHILISILLAISVTILFFVLYYIAIFLLKFLYHHKHRLPFLLVIGFVLFIFIFFASLARLDYFVKELNKIPYLIYNSTIKFEPESDIVKLSSEKTIAIKVSTGGESINMVSAIVKYDPKRVQIIDILTTNSFCDPSFFIEKEIIAEKGEVRITCGSPNPGFSGSIGTIAELLIQPLSQKPITLEFLEETQVLANDGLGTNVLRMATNGYYQVISREFNFSNIKNIIPIFSLTHPNSSRWYNKKEISFSWPKLLDATYYYNLNQNSIFNKEDKMLSTKDNNLDTSVVDDGIYYLHLQAKDNKGKIGPVSSFKIMIDSTPPLIPDIKVSSNVIKKGEILRLDFSSSDILSGLQSGFYVNINNNIFLPINPPFYIPFISSGEYPITVRVFDKANNFSDNKITIDVSH